MAIANGLFKNLRGSVGSFTFYQRNGRTIVREKGMGNTSSTKSAKQLLVRSQWNNVINTWKGLIDNGQQPYFANRKMGQTNYNAFVSHNLNSRAVFLTDEMGKAGACLLAPYIISDGGLAPIHVSCHDGINQTNIALGNLIITEETTIGELTCAIVNNNRGSAISRGKDAYNVGDRITYLHFAQYVDEMTGVPYVVCRQHTLTLGYGSDRKVWAVVGKEGFRSQNGFLAAASALQDSGEAWVHQRYDIKNQLCDASRQSIVCHNSILRDYICREALDEAFLSFGGITKNTNMMTIEDLEYMLDSFVEDNAKAMGISLEDDTPEQQPGSQTVVVSVVASPTQGGSVSGGGSVAKGTQLTLRATANSGYRFVRWNDGDTNATRTVTASATTSYTAVFESTSSGGGGSQGGYDSGN